MTVHLEAAKYARQAYSNSSISVKDFRFEEFETNRFLIPELQKKLARQNVPNPIRTTNTMESAGMLGYLERPTLNKHEFTALVKFAQQVKPELPIIIGQIPPKPIWRRIIEIVIKGEGFTDQALLQIIPDQDYDVLTHLRRRKCAKTIVDIQILEDILGNRFKDIVRQKRLAIPQRYGFSKLSKIYYIDWYSELGLVIEGGEKWLHYILTPFGAFYTDNQH